MIIAFDRSGLIFPEFSVFYLLNFAQTGFLFLAMLGVTAYYVGKTIKLEKPEFSGVIPIIILFLLFTAFVQLTSWFIVDRVSNNTVIGSATVSQIAPVGREAKIILSNGSFFTNDINVLYPVTPMKGDTVKIVEVKDRGKYAFVGKQGFHLNR